MSKNLNICPICGKVHDNSKRSNMCRKHYEQYRKYKRIICANSRTVFDKNEVRILDNYCEIDTYDEFGRTLKTFRFSKEDLPIINKYNKWQCVTKGTHIKSYYLITTFEKKKLYFHRLIFNEPDKEVDHINRETDNTRENLRLLDRSGQCLNTRKRENTTSKVKGVYYSKKPGRISLWHSEIQVESERHYSRHYRTEEEAIYARKIMEEKFLGDKDCFQDKDYMEKSISKLTDEQKNKIKSDLINKWKH